MRLKYLALSWLRFEKGCRCAFFERSPRFGIGLPDVIGITEAGFLLEIEIKSSMSDFAADFNKPHRLERNLPDLMDALMSESKFPKQFWYLAEKALADKIKPRLPKWAGLLTVNPGEFQISCIVKAPVNEASKRLTTKEKIRAGYCMANQILSMAAALSAWKHSEESDWGLEYRI